MNISVETEIAQRKKRQVVFTGTILPPTSQKHGSMEHCCEEFTSSEVDALCTALQGLPLCLEHGDGLDGRPNLTVGTVLRAWQADDQSVRVMCSIDQQNELADHVREQVLNRQLPDLSLSHSYEMFMTDDRVALLKSPIEVSVCSMGAREGTHIIDRAIMACSNGKQTKKNNYIPSSKPPKYIGKLQASASMSEAEMTDVAPASAPADVVEESAAPVAAAAEMIEQSAAPAAVVEEAPAVPASAPTDTNDLLAMNREQLAAFTAKVTSEASNKVDEMTRAMEEQQNELQQLRAEHQKRVDEQKAKEQEAFSAKVQELQKEGFNESGLLSGIEKMAQSDMNGAMSMLSSIVAASRAKEEQQRKHMESLKQKREEEVKQHFQEAAASYKRLLSGNMMASANTQVKRSKIEAAPVPAPVPVPIQETATPMCTQPAAEIPITVEASAPAALPVCRTYFEANALLRRKGTVQASTLGRNAMPAQRAVRDYNLTPTDEQKGLHGLQHWNQPLFEELMNGFGASGGNVVQSMHQTATLLQNRSTW